MNNLLINFPWPLGDHTLTFEDDGKVAYAYLKKRDEIVGDVWLYNRCETPSTPEWLDPAKRPFANSKNYIDECGRLERQIQAADVLVDWVAEEDGPVAYIYIFRQLFGVVGVNDKPGYARFAVKDGPLARVMTVEEYEGKFEHPT